MSDDEVVKAGIKAALKFKRRNKKNGFILETEFERIAIDNYKERLKEKVKNHKFSNPQLTTGRAFNQAIDEVLTLIDQPV